MTRLGLGHQQVTRAVGDGGGGGRGTATFMIIVIIQTAARLEFDDRRANGTGVGTRLDAQQAVAVTATVGRQSAIIWEDWFKYENRRNIILVYKHFPCSFIDFL